MRTRLAIASYVLVLFCLAACGDTTTETDVSSIVASDQAPAPVDVVVIDEVVAAEGGWIVIHQDSDGGYGAVLGHAAVEAGESTDVAVTLWTC